MSEAKIIYCCGCNKEMKARLTNGSEIYPHRTDLMDLPFWKCDSCKNYVGCHHKTKDRTRPLGNIPTEELRGARGHIHGVIDPIWKSGRKHRGKVYAELSKRLGYSFHSGEIKTIEEARRIYLIAKEIAA